MSVRPSFNNGRLAAVRSPGTPVAALQSTETAPHDCRSSSTSSRRLYPPLGAVQVALDVPAVPPRCSESVLFDGARNEAPLRNFLRRPPRDGRPRPHPSVPRRGEADPEPHEESRWFHDGFARGRPQDLAVLRPPFLRARPA